MINIIKSAPQLNLLDLFDCRHITTKILEEAATLINSRINGTILKVFIGGTLMDFSALCKVSPLLLVVIGTVPFLK